MTSHPNRRSPDHAAGDMPRAGSAAIFEKRSRYRPLTATGAPLKHADVEFDADPAQRSNLWIGAGVLAVLGVGAWLILAGLV